jgi:hypothetical protein
MIKDVIMRDVSRSGTERLGHFDLPAGSEVVLLKEALRGNRGHECESGAKTYLAA